MTDKEKEAIRVLNEDLKLAKEEDSIDIDVLTGNLEIALNLIEKQQAEIEKLKNNNKDLLRKLRNRVKEVKKLEKYSLYKKEFATLNKRIEKKDKEIDILKTNNEIMQGELDRIGIDTLKLEKGMSTDDVIEEIKKKDKTINLMAEFMNRRSWKEHQVKDENCYCCKIEYGSNECEDCIKEYFKKKIGEETK